MKAFNHFSIGKQNPFRFSEARIIYMAGEVASEAPPPEAEEETVREKLASLIGSALDILRGKVDKQRERQEIQANPEHYQEWRANIAQLLSPPNEEDPDEGGILYWREKEGTDGGEPVAVDVGMRRELIKGILDDNDVLTSTFATHDYLDSFFYSSPTAFHDALTEMSDKLNEIDFTLGNGEKVYLSNLISLLPVEKVSMEVWRELMPTILQRMSEVPDETEMSRGYHLDWKFLDKGTFDVFFRNVNGREKFQEDLTTALAETLVKLYNGDAEDVERELRFAKNESPASAEEIRAA